jgi:hypothetical protein
LARGLGAALGLGESALSAAFALTFFFTTLGFLTTGAESPATAAGLARVLVSAAEESGAAFSAITRGLRGARGFFGAAVSATLLGAALLAGATFAAGVGAGVIVGGGILTGAAEVFCTEAIGAAEVFGVMEAGGED